MGRVRSQFTVKGTDGDNRLEVPPNATLLNTVFDGGRGHDTLDLSNYASAGVYVRIEYGFAKAKSGVAEKPFTGVFTEFSLSGFSVAEGTIRNVESVIGTRGNDFLFVDTIAGEAKTLNGGDGNDVVNALGGNALLIGGTGSDWLVSYWENNRMIAGANDGDLTTSDGVRDFFYLGSAPTILDYEVGTDHMLIELDSSADIAPYYSSATAVWLDEGTGVSLYVNGVREVTLANVVAARATEIQFGVVVSPVNNEVWGGPGDDMLFAGGSATFTRVMVGLNTGDDVIINFDLANDTLVFQDGVTPLWSNTRINGEAALVGSFEGGSVTIQGLSMSDVSAMMITGSRGTLSLSTSPTQSAWSVPSDFPPHPDSQAVTGDWLL